MSTPLQTQLFDAFLGTQEGIHSIILPDIFSSGGSTDVYLDKFGRVSSILAPDTRGTVAISGGSLKAVRAIFPFRSVSGSTVTRKLLAMVEGPTDYTFGLSTDAGVNWSTIPSGNITALVGSGRIPDAAQFNQTLYITTGGGTVPKYWNASSTQLGVAGQTQSPAITAAASATTGNLTGYYTYKLVSVFADASRKAGATASTPVNVQGKQMSLTWTPDVDASVQGYEIYRTTGTGSLFYFVTAVTGVATASYTDNFSDTTISGNRILQEHGDAPPAVYYCVPHKGRMWWLRTDTYPTRGYWSDVSLPESVYVFNFLDFSDVDTAGDAITGAIGNFQDQLIVFTERGIWTVSGTGALLGDITDWNKQRSNARIGAVSKTACTVVPAGAKFTDPQGNAQSTEAGTIAFFTPFGDIRLFDGKSDTIISTPLKATLAGWDYSSRKKIHVLHDAVNGQMIWFVPTIANATSEPSICAVWNYRHGVWHTWNCGMFSSSVVLETATNPAVLVTGSDGVTNLDTVNTFFSTNQPSVAAYTPAPVWMTKTLYGQDEQGEPDMAKTKRWRWADLMFRIAGDTRLKLEWLPGIANDASAATDFVYLQPGSSLLVTANGSTVVTANGSTILVSAASAQVKKQFQTAVNPFPNDTGIRLRVSTDLTYSTTTPQWSLEAMEVGYQTLPGQSRRFQ